MQKLTVSENLKGWCIGFGINSSIIDRPDVQQAIQNKDGVAVHEIISQNCEPLEGLPRERMDRPNRSNHLLECSALVNESEQGFLMAMLLGGEKLDDLRKSRYIC